MRNIKKYSAVALVVAALAMPAKQSHAVFGVGDVVFDPTIYGQDLLQGIKEVGQHVEEMYQWYENNIQGYVEIALSVKAGIDDATKIAHLLKQISELEEGNGLSEVANDLSEAANEIAEIIQECEEINLELFEDFDLEEFEASTIKKMIDLVYKSDSMAAALEETDAEFEEKYPGWGEYKDTEYGYGVFKEKYIQWSEVNRENIKANLQSIGVQGSMLESEQAILAALREKAAKSEGNMQIMRVLAEMSAEQIRQMQELRILVMADGKMKSSFYAQQQDMADLTDAQLAREAVMSLEPGAPKVVIGDSTYKTPTLELGKTGD